MVPETIKLHAKAKHLGTFEQCYSESPSRAAALFVSFFFGGGAILSILLGGGAILSILGLLIPEDMRFSIFKPAIVQFCISPFIVVPVCILILRAVWTGYLKKKESWLYLYRNGFVFDRQGHIQSYHVREILSMDSENFGFGVIVYTVNLVNGEHLKIKHGAEVKARVERYQRQLRNHPGQ